MLYIIWYIYYDYIVTNDTLLSATETAGSIRGKYDREAIKPNKQINSQKYRVAIK